MNIHLWRHHGGDGREGEWTDEMQSKAAKVQEWSSIVCAVMLVVLDDSDGG